METRASSIGQRQCEASDALIDEVGALLTESGGAQIIETVAPDRFAAKTGDLRLRQGFAIGLRENKPYGPHEGECWDFGKNSDVKELFEMIAFERPMIVTGSPPCGAFSKFQNASWYPEWEKWQATKLLHVAMDVYEEQIRAGRYFLHEHPLEASSWSDPRVISLQKRKGVFTASSPVCFFQAKIETKDGSRNVNRFVYKRTKWMTNSKALAEALEKRCSNSESPFHRHIVLNGGLAKMATTYAPKLVNTVLRGLRHQMLDDGWISELELQFAGPSPSEPVFDLKDESATQWADEFDDLTGAELSRNLVHAGKMEEIRWVKELDSTRKSVEQKQSAEDSQLYPSSGQ